MGKTPLEQEMATHCSVLAWKISWTDEPGGLQSMGSRVDTNEHMNILLVSLISVWKFISTKLMGQGFCQWLLSLEH